MGPLGHHFYPPKEINVEIEHNNDKRNEKASLLRLRAMGSSIDGMPIWNFILLLHL